MLIIQSPDDFRRYAGKDLDRWNLMVGGTVEHPDLGIGVVEGIHFSKNIFYRSQISIRFDNHIERFNFSFLHAFSTMTFPTSSIMFFHKNQIDISGLKTISISLPGADKRIEMGVDITKNIEDSITIEPDCLPFIEATEEDVGLEKIDIEIDSIESLRTFPPPLFQQGDEVFLRTDPSIRGIVRAVPELLDGKYMYAIFLSADKTEYFPELVLQKSLEQLVFASDEDFLRDLVLLKLRLPFTDNLYSAYASKTKFEVYQFKPAMKFLRGITQRMLIADEVGLGKTIEAGIIFLELQARLRDFPRVLILCPASLKHKWQDELKLRFDEKFDLFDKQMFLNFFKEFENTNGQQRLRAIASLESLRSQDVINRLHESQLLFDLIVIDEAHHCRNSESNTHRLAAALEEQADAMLMLTATPLQTSNTDLFNLFNILDPGEFDNYSNFEERLIPNAYINNASKLLKAGDTKQALSELKKVERTSQNERFLGNPYYRDVVNLLEIENPDRKQLIKAQESLLDLNTLSFYYTRTRKRDVIENPPERTAQTIKVSFTHEEQQYYQQVVNFYHDKYIAEHPGKPMYTWVTMMKERQVASCLSAFHQNFKNAPEVQIQISEEDRPDQIFIMDEQADDFFRSVPLQGFIEKLNTSAYSIRNAIIEGDSKFDQFYKALLKLLEEDPNVKVIVFSYFTATVEYLYERLNALDINAIKIYGKDKIPDRHYKIERFRTDNNIRVLISSDVGAEGLDFQFCDTIFNFDLHWNPMRIEQRIGRIDRFGQKSNRIRVYNMVIEGSIEERILLRLYDRIGLFKSAIGDIEEILGEEIKHLVEMVYSQQLTPEEEAHRVEQTAENILRRKALLEEFDKRSMEFMGQDVIFANRVNELLQEGGFISENELSALVGSFVRNRNDRSYLDRNLINDGTYTFLPSQDMYLFINNFILRNLRNDISAKDFLTRLRAGKEMPLTFSAQVANERRPLEFITARHPLVRAARQFWQTQPRLEEPCYRLRVDGDSGRMGEYHFFIYTMEMRGSKSNTTLETLVINPLTGSLDLDLSKEFLNLMQHDRVFNSQMIRIENLDRFRQSERRARSRIAAIRDEREIDFKKENNMFVSARKNAITQSYQAKRVAIEHQLDIASNERIIRMHQGHLRNVTSHYEGDLAELFDNEDITVSYSERMKGIIIFE